MFCHLIAFFFVFFPPSQLVCRAQPGEAQSGESVPGYLTLVKFSLHSGDVPANDELQMLPKLMEQLLDTNQEVAGLRSVRKRKKKKQPGQ